MLATVQAQVIHKVFQPSNVLVDPDSPAQVTGVVDFGDMIKAARIIDVAVASAYHIARLRSRSITCVSSSRDITRYVLCSPASLQSCSI